MLIPIRPRIKKFHKIESRSAGKAGPSGAKRPTVRANGERKTPPNAAPPLADSRSGRVPLWGGRRRRTRADAQRARGDRGRGGAGDRLPVLAERLFDRFGRLRRIAPRRRKAATPLPALLALACALAWLAGSGIRSRRAADGPS